jgi:hypothetical protein
MSTITLPLIEWQRVNATVQGLRAHVEGLRAALEQIICRECHNPIGFVGEHSLARNATYGVMNWRTCPGCKQARTAIAAQKLSPYERKARQQRVWAKRKAASSPSVPQEQS